MSKKIKGSTSKEDSTNNKVVVDTWYTIITFLTVSMITVLSVIVLTAWFSGCNISADKSSSDNKVSTVDIDNAGANAEDVVTPGQNPICDSIMSADGLPGGFTWKPVSELDSKAVVLFPEEFVNRFTKVFAYTTEGDAEEAVYAGITNGGRQTWRFPQDGNFYSPTVYADEFTQQCVWIFPDASERQD